MKPGSPSIEIDCKVIDNLRGLFDEPQEAATFINDLIRIFDQAGAATVAEMRATLARNETKSLMNLAHKLKGISRNLGAERLGAFCGKLEKEGAALAPEAVKDLLEAINAAFDASSSELHETYYKSA